MSTASHPISLRLAAWAPGPSAVRVALWAVSATVVFASFASRDLIAGSLTSHMAAHILLMNVAAPLVALTVVTAQPVRSTGGPALAAAAILQVAALWGAHSPPALELAILLPGAHILLQALLLTVALWFWLAVWRQAGVDRWRALIALLVTAKLFCLLGVLLVFSPRSLYPGSGAHALHPGPVGIDALADQQLAGLIMLVACPLSYLVAGVAIAALWLREMSAGHRLPAVSTAPHTGH